MRHQLLRHLGQHPNIGLGILDNSSENDSLVLFPEILHNVLVLDLKTVGLLVSDRLLWIRDIGYQLDEVLFTAVDLVDDGGYVVLVFLDELLEAGFLLLVCQFFG